MWKCLSALSHRKRGALSITTQPCGFSAVTSESSHEKGLKPKYHCPQCSKRFTKSTTLRYSNMRPFACRICDKSFTRAKRYAASHNGEGDFICAGCDVSHDSARTAWRAQLSKSWGCGWSFSGEDGLHGAIGALQEVGNAYRNWSKGVSGTALRQLNGVLGNNVDAQKSVLTRTLSFHILALKGGGSVSFLSCFENQGSGVSSL